MTPDGVYFSFLFFLVRQAVHRRVGQPYLYNLPWQTPLIQHQLQPWKFPAFRRRLSLNFPYTCLLIPWPSTIDLA